MRITGVEPALTGNQILSLARLPIPPYPQKLYIIRGKTALNRINTGSAEIPRMNFSKYLERVRNDHFWYKSDTKKDNYSFALSQQISPSHKYTTSFYQSQYFSTTKSQIAAIDNWGA